MPYFHALKSPDKGFAPIMFYNCVTGKVITIDEAQLSENYKEGDDSIHKEIMRLSKTASHTDSITTDSTEIVSYVISPTDDHLYIKHILDKCYSMPNVLLRIRFTSKVSVENFIHSFRDRMVNCPRSERANKYYSIDNSTSHLSLLEGNNIIACCYDDTVLNGANATGACPVRFILSPINYTAISAHAFDLSIQDFKSLVQWMKTTNASCKFIRHFTVDEMIRIEQQSPPLSTHLKYEKAKSFYKLLSKHQKQQAKLCRKYRTDTNLADLINNIPPTLAHHDPSKQYSSGRAVNIAPIRDERTRLDSPSISIVRLKNFPTLFVLTRMFGAKFKTNLTIQISPIVDTWLYELCCSISFITKILEGVFRWPDTVLKRVMCMDAATGTLYIAHGKEFTLRTDEVQELVEPSVLLTSEPHCVITFPGLEWSACIELDADRRENNTRVLYQPSFQSVGMFSYTRAIPPLVSEAIVALFSSHKWASKKVLELLMTRITSAALSCKAAWLTPIQQHAFIKTLLGEFPQSEDGINASVGTIVHYRNPFIHKTTWSEANTDGEAVSPAGGYTKYVRERVADKHNRVMLWETYTKKATIHDRQSGKPIRSCELWNFTDAQLLNVATDYSISEGLLHWLGYTLFFRDRL